MNLKENILKKMQKIQLLEKKLKLLEEIKVNI